MLIGDASPWTDGVLIPDLYVGAIPALRTPVPATFAHYFLLLVLKPQSDVPSCSPFLLPVSSFLLGQRTP